jgi:hypothetical protein
MKKWSIIVLVALFVILGVLPVVQDIITHDTVDYLGYFAEQPRRLLWVAAIAIGTGLVALAMHRLVIPALKKPTVAYWLRPLLLVFVVGTGSLALYVLSLGPVLRLCKVSPSAGRGGVPSLVQLVYSPLWQISQGNEGVSRVLDDYVRLWIGVQ